MCCLFVLPVAYKYFSAWSHLGLDFLFAGFLGICRCLIGMYDAVFVLNPPALREVIRRPCASWSHRSLTSAGFSASPIGKYHYPQTCHRHVGSNPTFTALDYRRSVHAARLITLINVPDDLYIQFSKFSEAAFPLSEKVPSLASKFRGVFLGVSLKKFFQKTKKPHKNLF